MAASPTTEGVATATAATKTAAETSAIANDSIAALQRELQSWGGDLHRDLPWRRTRDPWAVLVSETMLQQTQVSRVVPRYETFMARFGTVHAAAAAPVSALVELWAGLGYNRRAVQLHAAARMVVRDHDGVFPDDLNALLALPGVGPYTARAVLAFANERDVAVLDTNVARVLARWVGHPMRRVDAQAVADSLVPAGQGWWWNQAMLDFGATLCTKRSPRCEECPLVRQCAWRGIGADPAVGSAGVSGGQSRFVGSDRQGRGRLVDALRRGRVSEENLHTVMGWAAEPERAHRVAAGVVADGLAVQVRGWYSLPN